MHNPATKNSYKKKIFALHKRMLNLSLKELRKIAKMRRIKGYKKMSKEKLLSVLDESECNSIESAGSTNNFNNARIKKIREYFNKLRDRFLKPRIK